MYLPSTKSARDLFWSNLFCQLFWFNCWKGPFFVHGFAFYDKAVQDEFNKTYILLILGIFGMSALARHSSPFVTQCHIKLIVSLNCLLSPWPQIAKFWWNHVIFHKNILCWKKKKKKYYRIVKAPQNIEVLALCQIAMYLLMSFWLWRAIMWVLALKQHSRVNTSQEVCPQLSHKQSCRK